MALHVLCFYLDREYHLLWPLFFPKVKTPSLPYTHAVFFYLKIYSYVIIRVILINLQNCVFVCLGSPTFYKIIKNKAVEGFKPDPYLATTLNCLFWVLYGTPFVHPGTILVSTINGVGIVIELIYLCIFLLYANDNKQRVCTYLLNLLLTS